MAMLLIRVIQVLIGLTFLVPVIVVPGQIYPTLVPKVLVFRSLAELILGTYIMLVMGNWDRFKIRPSPISISIALFTLSMGISTLVGVDWRQSVFDTYHRMLGLDSLAHYVAFYFVTTTILTGWATWKKFLRFFLGAVVLVLVVGIAQKFNQAFVANSSERASATLGNAIYLGGLGGFTVWIALLLALTEEAKGWRLDYFVAGCLGFVGVIISESRGALIALIAGVMVLFMGYMLLLNQDKKRHAYFGMGMGVCALLPLLLIVMVGYQGHKADALHQTITQDRASLLMKWADATDHPALRGQHDEKAYITLLEELGALNKDRASLTVTNLNAYLTEQGSALDDFTEKSLGDIKPAYMTIESRDRPIRTDRSVELRFAQARWYSNIPGLRRFRDGSEIFRNARLMSWAFAIDAFKERPVFGWGLNNFEFAYNKSYQPHFFGYAWSDTRFDDAHNVLFNTLTEQGIVGLMSYLLVVGAPIVCLWRGYRRGVVDIHLALVGTAFMTTHLVHNLFVFENPTSYLYFFFMLALFNSQTLAKQPDRATNTFRLHPIAAIGVAGAIITIMWTTNFRTAAESKLDLDTNQLIRSGDLQKARQAIIRSQASLTLGPGGLGADQGHAVLKRLMVHRILGKEYQAPPQAPHIIATAVNIAQSKHSRQWSESVKKFATLNPQQKLENGPAVKKDLHPLAVLAYKRLGDDLGNHPLDIHLSLLRGRIALQMAYQFDDDARMHEVETELEHSLINSPQNQEILYVLAAVKLCLSKSKQAIECLETAIQGLPKSDEGWWRLVEVYKATNQDKKVQEVIRRAKRHGVLVIYMHPSRSSARPSHQSESKLELFPK